jgi:hypothetical protein
MQHCRACDEKTAKIEELLQRIAVLEANDDQLAAVQEVDRAIVPVAPTLINEHWGSVHQESIDAEMAAELPHFVTLLRFGKTFCELKIFIPF